MEIWWEETHTVKVNPTAYWPHGVKLFQITWAGEAIRSSYYNEKYDYSFMYSPSLLNQSLKRFRYFASWMMPSAVPLLSKAEDRKLHDCITSRTMKSYVKKDPARFVEAHILPNFLIKCEYWENAKTTKRGRKIPEIRYEDRCRGRADEVKAHPGEFIVDGNKTLTKYCYYIVDIDYKGEIPEEGNPTSPNYHDENKLRERAKKLGAVSFACTSFGCYHIVFKSLRDHDANSLSFRYVPPRLLLVLSLLGYSAKHLFPYVNFLRRETDGTAKVIKFLVGLGVDKVYLTKDQDNVTTRGLGSWNYKKSTVVYGDYFENEKVYDNEAFKALYEDVLLPVEVTQPAEATQAVDAAHAANDFQIGDSPQALQPIEAPLPNKEVSLEPAELSPMEVALSPIFRSRAYCKAWADLLTENTYFLSSDEPSHGFSMVKLSQRFGIDRMQVSRTLKLLVKHEYLQTNGAWNHPAMKGYEKGKDRVTKRYCFGIKLQQFKVSQKNSPGKELPYERTKSRSGVFRDINRLFKKGLTKEQVFAEVIAKYEKYTRQHGIEAEHDVLGMIEHHFIRNPSHQRNIG